MLRRSRSSIDAPRGSPFERAKRRRIDPQRQFLDSIGEACAFFGKEAVEMALSSVMQAWITQQEFAKLLMLGSNGAIELTPPMTDDDRRDFEVHLRKHFGFATAVQIKTRFRITRLAHKTAHYLQVTIDDFPSRIVRRAVKARTSPPGSQASSQPPS